MVLQVAEDPATLAHAPGGHNHGGSAPGGQLPTFLRRPDVMDRLFLHPPCRIIRRQLAQDGGRCQALRVSAVHLGDVAGQGAGGGIASAGILAVLGTSLEDNLALGHDGGGSASSSDGRGGLDVAGGTATLLDTTIGNNWALGGNGQGGGNGLGGGVYVASGNVLAVASEITDNQAQGGSGEDGGPDGLGVGGGVYNLGTFLLDPLTVIALNHASTSHDDCYGC